MPEPVILVANGDLRLAANQKCWPAQSRAEEAVMAAIRGEGFDIRRGHPYDPAKQHGFIDSQMRGMQVFRDIPPTARPKSAQPAVSANVDEREIAALAYQYWQERGCPIGSDQEDWFRAEPQESKRINFNGSLGSRLHVRNSPSLTSERVQCPKNADITILCKHRISRP